MKKLIIAFFILLAPVTDAQDGTITFTGQIVTNDGPKTVEVSAVKPPTSIPLLDYYVTQSNGVTLVTVTYQ